MQDGVTIGTNEKELDIKYGPNVALRDRGGLEERELARVSVKYILTDMNDIRRSYIRLGFHLSEFRRNNYFLDFGYASMEDFCDANLGLDKSAVSRCISVFEAFSLVEGHTHKMQLDDKYKDYSYSQLCEMVSMSDKERAQIKPEMTIKQIREKKKEFAAADSTAHVIYVNEFMDVPPVATSQQEKFDYDKYLVKKGIVLQNYMKNLIPKKESVPVYIYGRDGKKLSLGKVVDVLEFSSKGLFIRLQYNDYEISEAVDKE